MVIDVQHHFGRPGLYLLAISERWRGACDQALLAWLATECRWQNGTPQAYAPLDQTSACVRQSSQSDPSARKDPEFSLLSRYPLRRLDSVQSAIRF